MDPCMLKVTEPLIINHIYKVGVKEEESENVGETSFGSGETSNSKICQLINSVQDIKSLLLSKNSLSSKNSEICHEKTNRKTEFEKLVVNTNQSILEDLFEAEISSDCESKHSFEENEFEILSKVMFSPVNDEMKLDEIVLVCPEELKELDYTIPEVLLEDNSLNLETDMEDVDGDLGLHEAVRLQNLAAVRRLLAQGVDPNEPDWCGNGDPPILQAVLTQNISIIK